MMPPPAEPDRQTRACRRVVLLGALPAVLLAGCNASVTELDRQVTQMIEDRQRLMLGDEGISDASAGLPAYPARNAALYDEQPATINPKAGDLPTRRTDQAHEPATLGSIDMDAGASPVELDLPALLAYAIGQAPEYREEKERLFLATLSLIIERHEWGPRFFNTLSADVSGTPESGDYDTALGLVNDFTVSQRLPYGGTASVAALVNYTNLLQRASTTTTAMQTQDTSLSAAINLPLLRGAGMVAREGLIQAERDLVYVARDFERFRREFFVDISSTYFRLLRQQQSIENQRRQVDGLQALADRQRALFEADQISRFEADDADAQVLFGRSDLAEELDNYQAALDALKLRIGMPVTTELTITRADIDVPNPALDAAKSIRLGQRARLDLQTTADRVDDAKRAVRVARDQLRGDLDLDASIDVKTDSGADTGGIDFDLGDSDYRVGLEYGLPLDRKIERAQYRSSLVDLEQAQRTYRVARDRVALDIRAASRAIRRAKLTLELQEENVRLAKLRLESLQIRVLRPKETIQPRRIIEAEEDLLEARNRRDQARADLQTSVLNYLLETGQMRVNSEGKWLAPGELVREEEQTQPIAKPDA